MLSIKATQSLPHAIDKLAMRSDNSDDMLKATNSAKQRIMARKRRLLRASGLSLPAKNKKTLELAEADIPVTKEEVQEMRLLINSRERTRMQDLNRAMEQLKS
ncbi:hypothetical protein Ciccas_005006, partial [Cichlidogyrus casuarinus]